MLHDRLSLSALTSCIRCSDRRSQFYLSDTVSASGEEDFDDDNDDDDADFMFDEENQSGVLASPSGRSVPDIDTSVVGEWDEEDMMTPGPSTSTAAAATSPFLPSVPEEVGTPTPRDVMAHERTPLLRKTTSLSFLERTAPPRAEAGKNAHPRVVVRRTSTQSTRSKVSLRRGSTGKAVKMLPTGQSTFGQTVRDRGRVLFYECLRMLILGFMCSCSTPSLFSLVLACCPSPWLSRTRVG